jgi:hypothetical protein
MSRCLLRCCDSRKHNHSGTRGQSRHRASAQAPECGDPTSSARFGEYHESELHDDFTVDQSPEDAFAAINNVSSWSSGTIEGSTDKLGGEFTYRYEDVHYSIIQNRESLN